MENRFRNLPSAEEYTPQFPTPGFYLHPFQDEKEIHLRDYWKVIRKRQWLIIAIALIAVVITFVKIYTTRPVYRGTATVQINIENLQVLDFKEVSTVSAWAADYYQTQFRILESRNLARRVIRNLRLWEHPEFLPQPPTPFEQWKAKVRSSLSSLFKPLKMLISPKGDKSPNPGPGRSTQTDLSQGSDLAENDKETSIINGFLGKLKIEPVKDSRIVKIQFLAHDPDLSAQVPNVMASSYIQWNLESRSETSEQAKEWLSKQLEELKAKVEQSDEALQEFGSQHDIISSLEDKDSVTMRRLSELNDALTKAEAERMAKEAVYKQIKQEKDQSIDLLPPMLETKLFQDLKQNYISLEAQYLRLSETFRPNYPEVLRLKNQMEAVQKRLQMEGKRIIAVIKSDYEATLRREFLLRTAFDRQKGKALEMQQKVIRYNILKREADTNKELYRSLLQRIKEVGVTATLTATNIHLLDKAEVPRSPYNPNAQRNLLLAAIIGLSLGLGLAFFFEYIDNTVKTPEEVEQQLRLPAFGMIPEMASEKRNLTHHGKSFPVELVSYGHPKSLISEAYRNIRTSILLSFSRQPPKKILITSPNPLEGKTTTLINTAITFTQTGARVLIIDADMRKPRVHKVFRYLLGPHQKNRIGLSSFLTGSSNLWSVIQKSTVQNLYLITSGPVPPNPAELLGSNLFREMTQALEEKFDHIIIDSPPLIGFADSLILSTVADGVMLVVLGGKTQREALQRAKDLLQQVGAKILGVVINRVDIRRSDYGYYYYRYYYYYGEEGKKKKRIPHLSGRGEISA